MSLTIESTAAAARTTTHNTFVIERSYPVPPERVFAAFADPAKKRRWFAESNSHEVEHYEMDFSIGGRETARFRFREGTPFNGVACTNEGTHENIVPNRRIVLAYRMAIGGNPISASLATVEFLPSATGTDLIFTHQSVFFEGSDGPEMRQDGWRKLLDRMAAELHA